MNKISSTFVDKDKFESINDQKIYLRIFTYYFLFTIFFGSVGMLATFVGFYFAHMFSFLIFVFEINFILVGSHCLAMLCVYQKRYKFFKKDSYAFLLMLPDIILTIIMVVSAIFLTKFNPVDSFAFSVDINPFFFLVIYFPIFIAYQVFIYFAFSKFFNGKLNKKPANYVNN